jgi:erythronate-4-phosphate dehydrogenase
MPGTAMKIVADENIAQVALFGAAGELTLLPGRAIDAAAVRDADALLVRSVTIVNEQLLASSRCRFVGTATAGIDHIDTSYLRERGIGLGWAQGCNADSVVDYVFSALAQLSERRGFDWRSLSFGIVGCGQIGSRLARKLLALKMPVAIHDPFLAASNPLHAHFASYERVLQQDVVSFHTPLTRSGEYPTWHMLDAERLELLKPDGVLINAARGGVVDNAALLRLLTQQPEHCVVLDAWEGEPAINPLLLEKVTLGTAHIAGYSLEGKLNGTRMIAADFSRHFRRSLPPVGGADRVTELRVEAGLSAAHQLNSLILQAYDVTRDSKALRLTLGTNTAAAQFDLLRKNYPLRREFSAHAIAAEDLAPEVAAQVRILGFRVY